MSVEGMNHLFLSILSAIAFCIIIACLGQCHNLTLLSVSNLVLANSSFILRSTLKYWFDPITLNKIYQWYCSGLKSSNICRRKFRLCRTMFKVLQDWVSGHFYSLFIISFFPLPSLIPSLSHPEFMVSVTLNQLKVQCFSWFPFVYPASSS